MAFNPNREFRRFLRKVPKQKKKLDETGKKIEDLVEEARRFLPLGKGGADPNPQRSTPVDPNRGRLPRVKVFNERPFFDGEEVRWRPTPGYIPPGSETVTIEDDMRKVFDNVDDMAAQEIAEEIYQIAEQTQNQEMENALAKIEARRPRQFRVTTRSRQFERQNLVPAPKKKRKVSAYSREFGKQLKKLKKLHPRTKVQNLMKRAHSQTRMAMKKKK
jgi:hypothetical protein